MVEIIRHICSSCNKKWSYEIEECPICSKKTEKQIGTTLKVIGITKVFLPSLNHEETPYNVVLLEDEHGNKLPFKTKKDYEIGDSF